MTIPIIANVNSIANDHVATINMTKTISAYSNRVLLAFVNVEAEYVDPTHVSVTYNGVAMTHLTACDKMVTSDVFYNRISVWYMLESSLPTSGSYTVTANLSDDGDIVLGAIDLYNATQSAPNATQVAGTVSGNPTLTITTTVDDCLILDVTNNGDGSTNLTQGVGQTEQYETKIIQLASASSSKNAISHGNFTMSWLASISTSRWVQAALAIEGLSSISSVFSSSWFF
jgi:hypothetical protein